MPTLLVEGRRVCFTDTGAGDPVLLLHAAASSSAQWRVLEPLLASRGFRVLALDLQGYGDSAPWDPRRPLLLEDELKPLRAVLAHLGGQPVHIIGHSYGALIALLFAPAHPAQVLSLTLIEPIAFWLLRGAGEQTVLAEIQAIATAFAEAFDAGDVEAAAAGFINYWSGPGTWRVLPVATRDYVISTAGKVRREWSLALGDAELDPNRPSCGRGDWGLGAGLAEYARLRFRTLVICGEQTKAPARRVAELLHYSLPRAEFVGIPNAGHMSPLTHPGAVSEAILTTIRQELPSTT